MAAHLTELLEVRELRSLVFETLRNPERMGNTLNIAYGGCTLGAATNAAYQTVGDSYRLYSAMGSFLGPALTDRKIQCHIRKVRDTRTFATRLVEVSQQLEGGKDRRCLVMLADFMRPEAASMLEFSKPPSRNHGDPRKMPTYAEHKEALLMAGIVSKKNAEKDDLLFPLIPRFIDFRHCEDSLSGQNLKGLAKNVQTAQDDLPLHQRWSADWHRLKKGQKISKHAEHVSAIVWILDMALSFAPLTHSHMFLDDAGAVSSLDFALRLFTNEVDITKWHLREIRAVTAGVGRSYSEAQLWDEEGNMVAGMTQQSILRPKVGEQSKL